MIIFAQVGTIPEKHFSGAGRVYYKLRVAENFATEKNKKANWYEIRASISAEDAQKLSVGMPVKVDGRLDASAYISKKALGDAPLPDTWEEVIAVLNERHALCVGLKILSKSVTPEMLDGSVPEKPDFKTKLHSLLAEQVQITASVQALQSKIGSTVGTPEFDEVMGKIVQHNQRSNAIKTEIEKLEKEMTNGSK